MKRVLIVAGEASADRYGASLVRRIRARSPGCSIEFFGTGGDEMRKAGVEIRSHIRDLASIGPREALEHFRKYYDTFQDLVRTCLANPPALALLLDFPEFNLRLARKMKRAGIRVIYYISPQVWAWRRGRIRIVQSYVDKMLVILPFEEDYYRSHGVDVEFVGHPLLEDFSPNFNREAFLSRLNLDPRRKTIALLPGSRLKEVQYLLPTLLEAAEIILKKCPAQFLISAAPSVEIDQIRKIASEVLRGSPTALLFKIVCADSRDILANSDFAFVKSGTSTLEAALVGTPFVIVYKISPASWYLGNILIRSPFKGLVNLIAREEVVPEFMQSRATPTSLAGAALQYLENPDQAANMRSKLSGIKELLSVRCASDTAAAAVLSYLGAEQN